MKFVFPFLLSKYKKDNSNKIKSRSRQEITDYLVHASSETENDILLRLNTSIKGLSNNEAEKKLIEYGTNEIKSEKRPHWIIRLIKLIANPLIALLVFIIFVSIFTHDYRTAGVIGAMILLSVFVEFFQENQA